MKTHPRVLVIASDGSMLNLMQDVLSPSYEVQAARDALEGADLLMSDRMDLLIVDAVLPVLTGVELIQILRAHRPYSEIPIIAYGSYPGNGVSLNPADVQAVLPLTFSIDELIHTVSATLERHAGHRSVSPAAESPSQLSA